MFRIDRIKDATVLDEPAGIPDDFDPSAYSGAFRERPGQPAATIEISPRAARWFEEYYPVRSARTLADGWRAVEIAYGKSQWIGALILSLGDDVRNVLPEEVAGAAARLAGEIGALYD